MTFKEARALRLKDAEGNITNEQIPTFQEVLDWNQNQALLVLDIKPGTDINTVLPMVRKAKATNNAIFILYSIADAKKVYENNKDIMFALGFNSREGIEAIKSSGLPFDHLVALTPRQEQDRSYYDSIHALGILCSRDEGDALKASSVETRKTLYRRMPETGTDIIVTLDPLFVQQIFK
jgi:glycerophosphoryl diester phosphodiesterase